MMYTLLLMKYILLENVKLVMCSELILGLPILKACCDGQKERETPTEELLDPSHTEIASAFV